MDVCGAWDLGRLQILAGGHHHVENGVIPECLCDQLQQLRAAGVPGGGIDQRTGPVAGLQILWKRLAAALPNQRPDIAIAGR